MRWGQAFVSVSSFELTLIGPFRLRAPDGTRVNVASKKGQALLAMLATSGNGERTRSWLQSQLWGTRAAEQAQSSLRNELKTLRNLLNDDELSLIDSDKNRVWLNLSLLKVDVRASESCIDGQDELLEGLDIAGEDGFEEWLREERARTETRSKSKAQIPTQSVTIPRPLPAPDDFARLPALAVLPFCNLTGEPEMDYLAEGISEDLIDRLARLRWLPIIARGSSFSIREADCDPRTVGDALGARYLVEARLRKQGEDFLLLASLANCETGQILWSSKLPLSDNSSEKIVEDLLAGLASLVGTKIDQEEQNRAIRKPESDLNVRDLIWRGRWHLNRMTKEDSEKAKTCFAEALAKEPNSPEAIIQIAWARVWELWSKRGTVGEIRAMRQLAQKAIIADCDDARGHMLAGIAEIWLHQPLRAEALLMRAIELNPSLAMAYAQLGASLRVRDKHEAAIVAFRTAIKLSPNDHDMFFFAGELAASLLMTGDYSEALLQADHAISRRRGYWFSHVIKVNALVRLDRIEDAKVAYGELLIVKSDFRPAFIRWSPFADPGNIVFLEEGLNQAAS
jgi:TolB-like protein